MGLRHTPVPLKCSSSPAVVAVADLLTPTLAVAVQVDCYMARPFLWRRAQPIPSQSVVAALEELLQGGMREVTRLYLVGLCLPRQTAGVGALVVLVTLKPLVVLAVQAAAVQASALIQQVVPQTKAHQVA